MYALYSLLTAAGGLLLLPYFLVRGLMERKYLSNIPERLGWKFPAELVSTEISESPEKSIWIHAVSVGEVLAALPLAQQLKQRHPRRRLLVSTTTITGQKVARERMPFADAVFYFPLDWTGPVHRALAAAHPGLVIIVETEIWPNFLRECRRAHVPVVFVNGRMSERSFRGYRRAGRFFGAALAGFLEGVLAGGLLYLMQGDEDAARLAALGAPAERIVVTGNLKYDFAEPRATPVSAWLEAELADGARGPVLIAGSLMTGEEKPVLDAFAEVEREYPRALLILAPRKPEEFDATAAIATKSGRKLVRRGELKLNRGAPCMLAAPGSVFLLDSLGELAALYRFADAVFVGGSLVPRGGHNILEPAAFSKVPIFGPSMENFRDMSAKFLSAGAAIQVRDSQELGAAWRSLLGDPDRAASLGASAKQLADRNRGATKLALEHIERMMSPERGGR